MDKAKILWSDKKRYFGMPISLTAYSLSGERLCVQTGIFQVKQAQTMLCRVQDVRVTVSFLQWLFRVGTVTVISDDKHVPDLKLKNIRNPLYVKEMVRQRVEAIRAEAGHQAQ